MRQEVRRLVRLAGCGAMLCGGMVLAQDAAPAAPAAAPAVAAAKPDMGAAFKELRGQIEAKEKAVIEANADLKTEIDALDAQIKAKRAEATPEARKEVRDLLKQRQEKLATADQELKGLYDKRGELMRQQFGGRGKGLGAGAGKPAGKKADKPAEQ